MDENLIESLSEALKQSPDNSHLRLALAGALKQGRRYEDAEKEYAAALAITPDNAEAKKGLAETFYMQGKISGSLVVCEELVKSGKADAGVYMMISNAHYQREDYEEAVKAYARARELDPSISDPIMDDMLGKTEEPDKDDFDENESEGRPFDEPDEPQQLREYVTKDPKGKFEPYYEKCKTSFEDVGGMEPVKQQIRLKIIHPLTNPEIYEAYGKKIGGGILMYGPPGCGKTHMARATAGEVKASFISVAISDVLASLIGESERNLRDIFQGARANSPSVLFFDEVDALGASRRDMRQSASRQVINQFLAELDGVESANDGVLVLGATNAPWHLDSAFRRPGRFDRIIFVPPPDRNAREAILRILLKGKPAAEVDVATVAKKTTEYSGADLKALVDVVVESKLEKAVVTGKPEPMTTRDFTSSIKKVKPSTREWFTTARNYAIYSNEGGIYDDILEYLGKK